MSAARRKAVAPEVRLATILGLVQRIERDSKAAQYTDTEAVWETLYAIRHEARYALRRLLAKGAK